MAHPTALQKLESVLLNTRKFITSLTLAKGHALQDITIRYRRSEENRAIAHVRLNSPLSHFVEFGDCCPSDCPTSITAAFELARTLAGGSAIVPCTLEVRTSNNNSPHWSYDSRWEHSLCYAPGDSPCYAPGEPLYATVMAAFEAIIPVTADIVGNNGNGPRENRHDIYRERLQRLLVGGTAEKEALVLMLSGNELWSMLDLEGANLSRIKYRGAHLGRLSLKNTDFSGSILDWADFTAAHISGASFRESSANCAKFGLARAVEADFTRAELKGADFSGANLTNAVFAGIDLIKADFSKANIRGVDFSSCSHLEHAKWTGAKYNSRTIFPENFQQREQLKWIGKGCDPVLARKKVAMVDEIVKVDFTELLVRLHDQVDRMRLVDAVNLVNDDYFQLLTEQDASGLIGVVKSKVHSERVAACRLTANGNFCCCNRNLSICSEMRGSMCKHILALILGATWNRAIDTTTMTRWIVASRFEKPKVDQKIMTAVFLRFASVKNEDVDWRPAELIPEDYYVF